MWTFHQKLVFFFSLYFFYEMQFFIHKIKQSLQIIVEPFQAVLLWYSVSRHKSWCFHCQQSLLGFFFDEKHCCPCSPRKGKGYFPNLCWQKPNFIFRREKKANKGNIKSLEWTSSASPALHMLPWDCDSLQRVKPIILHGEGKQRHWIGARTRGDFSSNLFWLFEVFPVSLRIFVLFRLCTNWIWNDWNIYLICALKVCISLTEPDAFQGWIGAGQTYWRGMKGRQWGAGWGWGCWLVQFPSQGNSCGEWEIASIFWTQMSFVEIMIFLAANSRFNVQMPRSFAMWEQGPLEIEWGHSAMELWPLLPRMGWNFETKLEFAPPLPRRAWGAVKNGLLHPLLQRILNPAAVLGLAYRSRFGYGVVLRYGSMQE